MKLIKLAKQFENEFNSDNIKIPTAAIKFSLAKVVTGM